MDFVDYQQYKRLHEHGREISQAHQAARSTAERTAELEATVDRLTLACKAMWELLGKAAGHTEETLLEKVREIDLRDGKLDGKADTGPKTCANCSRPNNPKRKNCLYCGEDLGENGPLDV